MKSYEEMANSVLKRRDEAIKAAGRRRRTVLKIGVPCAAVLTVAAVGGTIWAANRGERGSYMFKTSGEAENEITSFHAYLVSSADIASEDSPPEEWEPNVPSVPDDIGFIALDEFDLSEKKTVVLNDKDFLPMTVEQLRVYYGGVNLDALSMAYPTLEKEHEPLGVYREEGSDGFAAWVRYYWTRNTIFYADGDKKITVSAQQGAFDSPDPNYAEPAREFAGTSDGSYDTAASRPSMTVEEEDLSVVGGYRAKFYKGAHGGFLVDLEMNCCVRIIASGVSEEEFVEIVRSFANCSAS